MLCTFHNTLTWNGFVCMTLSGWVTTLGRLLGLNGNMALRVFTSKSTATR